MAPWPTTFQHTIPEMLGIVTITLWTLNLLFFGALLLLTIAFRLIPGSRTTVTGMLQQIVQMWARGHRRITDEMLDIEWEVSGLETLSPDANYLIVANHQSWLDVPIVEDLLSGRTSFIRFFAKRELQWFPIVGAALWALEMPMVRRIPSATIEKHPELREYDLATTRRACRQFGRQRPESLLSFAEGTRRTRQKYDAQNPPYRHLLKPKIGGISLVLAAVGDRLRSLIDLTIIYPVDHAILWRVANGEVKKIVVDISERPIPRELITPDLDDGETVRARVRDWFEAIWREKDETLTRYSGSRLP